MKLIDKDTVLAEIENRIRACGNCYILDELTSLHSTFNSLEAREVDYDKALTEYLNNFENASIGHRLSIRRTAKHFFELGLRNALTVDDLKLIWELGDEIPNMPDEEFFFDELLKRFKAQKGE